MCESENMCSVRVTLIIIMFGVISGYLSMHRLLISQWHAWHDGSLFLWLMSYWLFLKSFLLSGNIKNEITLVQKIKVKGNILGPNNDMQEVEGIIGPGGKSLP